jgi:hypothetical protein
MSDIHKLRATWNKLVEGITAAEMADREARRIAALPIPPNYGLTNGRGDLVKPVTKEQFAEIMRLTHIGHTGFWVESPHDKGIFHKMGRGFTIDDEYVIDTTQPGDTIFYMSPNRSEDFPIGVAIEELLPSIERFVAFSSNPGEIEKVKAYLAAI